MFGTIELKRARTRQTATSAEALCAAILEEKKNTRDWSGRTSYTETRRPNKEQTRTK